MSGRGGVLTGIDVLAREAFRSLRGSRIGLLTNHTGLTQTGQTTIDALHEAPSVSLEALFGPEHGIRGDHDENVADGTDLRTNLPVYSLFGTRTQPSSEQLAGLDTLVFDIQDIGCRFYTYLSTLGHILEAAEAHNLRIVVLDRPNPITGKRVEGPTADADKLAFVAYHPIPIRHGLTLGEMACLLHAEKNWHFPLEIVRCEGWQRENWFDATGLLWTNPSPNMRRLFAAALYPGIGLLEFTNVSVGRGTDTPFEIFGASFIEPRSFADALNNERLPGVRFVPVFFTPSASVLAGERCGGVQILVTDRRVLNSVQIGLTIAVALLQFYPESWEPEKLMTLLCHAKTYATLMQGCNYSEISSEWMDGLQDFQKRTSPHLLY